MISGRDRQILFLPVAGHLLARIFSKFRVNRKSPGRAFL
jgi:hypothetical protein